jgi:photosystem II stability/assembly factor-like uncharacterized protein
LDATTGLVDCPTVYVATDGGGVLKSSNGGGSWNRTSDGLVESSITELVMDPVDPKILYAGTENSGLFKTINGGTSWFNPSTSPDTIKSITAIAVDPRLTPCSPSPCIYVGSQESGVWVSEDEGLSWTQMNNGLTGIGMNVTALTISSYNQAPSDLYAGTEEGHLYRFNRLNNQNIWGETSTDESSNLSSKTNASPLVIAVNPIVPTHLYVGTSGGETQTAGSVFRSLDGGLTWNVVNIPNAQNFSVRVLTFCIQIEPRCPPTVPEGSDQISEPDVLYAGVYGLSRNFFPDEVWTNIDTGQIQFGNNVSSLAIDTLRHTTLYAGTLSGFVIKSQDAGATWSRIDINL